MKHYARQYCSNTECPTPSNCAVNGCHSPINPVGTVSPQPAPPSYRCAKCGHQQQDHGADGCSDAHRIWESARLDSMKWLRCLCKAFVPPDVPPQPAEPTGAKKDRLHEFFVLDPTISPNELHVRVEGRTVARIQNIGYNDDVRLAISSHPAEPERETTRNG